MIPTRSQQHIVGFQCLNHSTPRKLNIKMPIYEYMNSHYKDETVWRPYYLYDGNPYTREYGLYIETEPIKKTNAIHVMCNMILGTLFCHQVIYSHYVYLKN